METQTETQNNTTSQNDNEVPENNNLLVNMLNSFISQSAPRDSNVLPKDEEESEDEEESDDEESDDEDDDRWVALQKLLDSHLRITKCLLHMVKQK